MTIYFISGVKLNVYTGANIRGELEAAKSEFLQANIVVINKKSKKILLLPKLIEKYAKEAGIINSDDIIKWVSENVDGHKLKDSIQKCHEYDDDDDGQRTTSCKTKKALSHQNIIIKWLPFNSKFRYVLSKDLVS